MNPSVLLACQNKCFDVSLIAQARQDDIDAATMWAVENNNWKLAKTLQPHSKYNCPSGSFKMVRLAVEYGSTTVLNSTMGKDICNLMRNNPIHKHALIKSVLFSTHAVGIAWLIDNKSFFGLKDEIFHSILASNHNYLQASSVAVDVLMERLPLHDYDWVHMARRCAEEGDLLRCSQYLKHTPDDTFDRDNTIGKIIRHGVRCGMPHDFFQLFDMGRGLRNNTLENKGEILSFFKEALNNIDPQTAVEHLLTYYGHSIDFRPLGDEISNQIEHHKAVAQHKSIAAAVEISDRSTQTRKM